MRWLFGRRWKECKQRYPLLEEKVQERRGTSGGKLTACLNTGKNSGQAWKSNFRKYSGDVGMPGTWLCTVCNAPRRRFSVIPKAAIK